MGCNHCSNDKPTERNPTNGYLCCMECGMVLDQDSHTYKKTSDGGSEKQGVGRRSAMGCAVPGERVWVSGYCEDDGGFERYREACLVRDGERVATLQREINSPTSSFNGGDDGLVIDEEFLSVTCHQGKRAKPRPRRC